MDLQRHAAAPFTNAEAVVHRDCVVQAERAALELQLRAALSGRERDRQALGRATHPEE